MTTDFYQFLKSAPAFSALFDDVELRILERNMRRQAYAAGHLFCEEGKAGDEMYLIIDGEVEVLAFEKSQVAYSINKRLGPGELIGLVSLIHEVPRTATCRAVGMVTAACLPRYAFKIWMACNNPLAHKFQELVARQLAMDIQTLHRELASVVARLGGSAVSAGV